MSSRTVTTLLKAVFILIARPFTNVTLPNPFQSLLRVAMHVLWDMQNFSPDSFSCLSGTHTGSWSFSIVNSCRLGSFVSSCVSDRLSVACLSMLLTSLHCLAPLFWSFVRSTFCRLLEDLIYKARLSIKDNGLLMKWPSQFRVILVFKNILASLSSSQSAFILSNSSFNSSSIMCWAAARWERQSSNAKDLTTSSLTLFCTAWDAI